MKNSRFLPLKTFRISTGPPFRARFGRYVDPADVAPELSGVDSPLHLELLQGVDRRQKDLSVEIGVLVFHAVQRKALSGREMFCSARLPPCRASACEEVPKPKLTFGLSATTCRKFRKVS